MVNFCNSFLQLTLIGKDFYYIKFEIFVVKLAYFVIQTNI